MPGFLRGTKGTATVAGFTFTVKDWSGELTQNSVDVFHKGSDFADVVPTTRQASFKISGYITDASTDPTSFDSTTEAAVDLTSESGSVFSGNAIITKISCESSIDGVLTLDLEGKLSGDFT